MARNDKVGRRVTVLEYNTETGEVLNDWSIDVRGDVNILFETPSNKRHGRSKANNVSANAKSISAAKAAAGAHTPSNRGKRWSDRDEEVLVEMFNRGVKVYEIAKALGRTRTAIAMRLERNELISDYKAYLTNQQPLSENKAQEPLLL